ncbi:MAG: hypothetical protein K8F60_01625 [Melioribacteraceae bacterium]|jgi:hypothetical protein|nr:hypothetical protein [Melioribacteraceae bacterium]
MKILAKYYIVIILAIIFIPIFKNLYLYFDYYHNIKRLNNYNRDESNAKVFEAIVDSYEGGYDVRTYFKVVFEDNDKGYIYSKSFSNKIDGAVSSPFSFHSLLPYDKDVYLEIVRRFSKHKEYLLIYDKNSINIDTVYCKYKIDNNYLFLDKNKKYSNYYESPDWGFMYNSKPNILDLFQFWYF